MTRDDRPPIRTALLGFGLAGRIFHAPFIRTTPGLSLRVVATRQRERVTAEHPDVTVVEHPDEALRRDDIDLVVVATPNVTHAPLASAALAAGHHVVVDKPFTITAEEARGLVAQATAAGRVISVFQNRRWDSDFQGVRQAIADGVVGDVVELRSEIGRWRPQVRERWREKAGPGSGLWYDLGPHLLDQALVLFGAPTRIEAELRIQRPGGETVDWFHAHLAYPGRDVFLGSSVLAADQPTRFVVRGTTGTLVKRLGDPQESRLLAGARPGGPDWGVDEDPLIVWRGEGEPERHAVPRGDYGRFYAGIVAALRGEAEPPVGPEEAVRLMTALVTAAEG